MASQPYFTNEPITAREIKCYHAGHNQLITIRFWSKANFADYPDSYNGTTLNIKVSRLPHEYPNLQSPSPPLTRASQVRHLLPCHDRLIFVVWLLPQSTPTASLGMNMS